MENVSAAPTENLKIVDRLQALLEGEVIALASVPLDMSLNPCSIRAIAVLPVLDSVRALGGDLRNNARVTVTNDHGIPGRR